MKTGKFFVAFFAVILLFSFSKSFGQKVKVKTKTNSKTMKQIQALQNEKQSRTAIEQKIDSKLLQAIRESHGQKMAEGVELEPANVNADKQGNLQVDINAEVSDELLDKIKKLGGSIIFPSKQYHTIRAQINLSMVETIAGYSSVKFIEPAGIPMNNGAVKPINNSIKPTVTDLPVK